MKYTVYIHGKAYEVIINDAYLATDCELARAYENYEISNPEFLEALESIGY